jgi:hypothetical protein
LFRRPKLTLNCSAEGKERHIYKKATKLFKEIGGELRKKGDRKRMTIKRSKGLRRIITKYE